MSQTPLPSHVAALPPRTLDGKFQNVYRRAAEESLIYLETRGMRLLDGLREAMAESREQAQGEAQMLAADHLLSRRAAIGEFNRHLAQARATREHLDFSLRRRLEEISVAVAEAETQWNAFLAGEVASAAFGQHRSVALGALESEVARTMAQLDALCQTDPAWRIRVQVMRQETVLLCGHLYRVLGHFAPTQDELARVGNIMRSALAMMGDRAFLSQVRDRVYIQEGDIVRVRLYAPILEVPGVVCRFKGLWWKVWAWVGEPRRLPWLSEDFVAVARHAAARLDPDALSRGELALSAEFVDSVAGLTEPLAIRQARGELARARQALEKARAESPEQALRIITA
jgi:hypothetical protein